MSSSSPLHTRYGLVVTITVAALALALPPAYGSGPASSHDPLGETPLSGDPFVVEGEQISGGDPADPLSWVGAAPDPADIPAALLVTQPAREIVPATPAELMNAQDGYIGSGLADVDPLTGAATPTVTVTTESGQTTTSGQTTAVVPAPPTRPLPTLLDAAPPWLYTLSCDPNDKPGILLFAALVTTHYDRARYSTSRRCLAGGVNSQHYDGRAVDWMMNAYDADDKAIGDAVSQWITANNGEMARRFGIQLVIWNRRSWSIYEPGRWKDYFGPSPHTDHVHFSFSWDGAMGRTSWWDDTPVTEHDYGTCRVYAGQYAPRYTGRNPNACATDLPQPLPSPYPVILPGANNSYVRIAQEHLGFTGADLDGSFGPRTLSRLLSYQAAQAIPVTGVLDNATWYTMLRLGIPSDPPDPDPGPDPDPEPEPGPDPDSVTRVSGRDRYATAAELSRSYPVGGEVFVTTGTNYPDALAAAARAGYANRPVLLVTAASVPTSTRTALTRLQPTQITVVGGVSAVTAPVLTKLDEYTTGPVRRLGGEDRYATAAAVARDFGANVPVVYAATGSHYSDALVAAARAGMNNGPVLLTAATVPPATQSAMTATSPGRVVVVGATDAVSDPVAEQLRQSTDAGNLQRVPGSNRFSVAAKMASYYPAGVGTVYIATGYSYADSLTASAAAARDNAPILFVYTDSVPSTTKNALTRLNPGRIIVVGGSSSVSDGVLAQLADYVG